MGNIQHDAGAPGEHLETSRQLHFQQATPHVLHGNRQALVEGFQGGQHGAGVRQLAGAAQGGIGESAAALDGLTLTYPELPLQGLGAEIAKILTQDLEVGAQLGGVLQQSGWWIGIGADGHLGRAQDAGLFPRNGGARVAQLFGVIDVDGGDDGAVAVMDVGGIQAPAQADFQDDDVDMLCGKTFPGGQGAHLEIGELGVAGLTCAFDACEGVTEGGIADGALGDAYALVVMQQMWRGVQTDTIAGAAEDLFQHGAGRALAIGAGHGDHRAPGLLLQLLADLAYTFQPQFDAVGPQGVAAFDEA